MLIVEQNVGFALQAADRYSVIQRGEVVAEGAAGAADAAQIIHAQLHV
jgi:ABC-type branched-subunit amino acid transport system ATPase component